jgi:hypothetical protein
MTARRGIGEKDTDLAVLDTSSRSAILALDTSGMDAFFEKASLVDDTNGIRLSKIVGEIGQKKVAQRVRVPVGATEQVLEGIGSGVASDFGELPTIFALGRTEKASKVGHGTLTRFGAREERSNTTFDVGPVLVPDLYLKSVNITRLRKRGVSHDSLLRALQTTEEHIIYDLQL